MSGTNLTRDEAQARAALIETTSYEVALDVTTSPETFASTTTVCFTATTPGTETFIDLIAPRVDTITLNGRPLDPASHFDGVRVRLPGLEADNVLTIAAHCAFMTTGEGLHRFVDPADGEVYLYSQFEVPDSRRMMAVFEQPDLKATWTFTVTAPAHWQVISNAITPTPERVNETCARWSFPATERISSYITALVAGPYDVVRDSVETRAGTIPLGVFSRRSLTPYVDADNVFACTKDGFAFFEETFDCAYPFTKYDQIFAPEYNMGAMENAGCVTITEAYVFRGKVPDALIERRALTILHELAHMWFGDLVTMRWWDDLWLNESFAEWASTTCQAEVTQWSSAWTTFCTHEKAWAYRQDQLSSTHPIVAQIRDLEDVEVNFDGITYAKGAAVLKQLVAYVGREPFIAGLRSYFAKHAWGNTQLEDLLAELEATSGRDLRAWSRIWLETAGVNVLRPLTEVDGAGRITSATIEQTSASGDDLARPHRLAVGLYDLVEGVLTRADRLELDVDGARTQVPQLLGRPRPALLLVNEDDLTYAKLRLDPVSLATALANPRGFTETLPHSLVVASVWDMVRDAELSASTYLPYALDVIEGERDSTMLRALLQQVTTCLSVYLSPARRPDARALVLARLHALALAAEPDSDAQLQLVTAYAGLHREGDDPAYVQGLFDGSIVLPGLTIDHDVRWTLVASMAAMGVLRGDEIEAEASRDRTAMGRERAALARAAMPTAEAKAGAWAEGVEDVSTPNSVIEALAGGFQRVAEPSLLAPYVAQFHETIAGVWAARTHAAAEAINSFYPLALSGPELLAASNAWLENNPGAPAALRRVIAENRDGVERAVKAQARDAVAG